MQDFLILLSNDVIQQFNETSNSRQIFEKKPEFVKAGLYYEHKFSSVRKQNFLQQYFCCEMIKQTGNTLFQARVFSQSVKEYEQALSIFRYVKPRNKDWKKVGVVDDQLCYIVQKGSNNEEKCLINKIVLALYHNLAASYLKLNDHQNALYSCEEALKIDPTSVKALFRKAKALTSISNPTQDNYLQAIEVLQLAKETDPDNQEIKDAITTINMKLKGGEIILNYKNMFKMNKIQHNQLAKRIQNQEKTQKKFEKCEKNSEKCEKMPRDNDLCSPAHLHPPQFIEEVYDNLTYELSKDIDPNIEMNEEIFHRLFDVQGQENIGVFELADEEQYEDVENNYCHIILARKKIKFKRQQ